MVMVVLCYRKNHLVEMRMVNGDDDAGLLRWMEKVGEEISCSG